MSPRAARRHRRPTRTVVAVCGTCDDYAEEGALLYRHGQDYRHVANDSRRCPGQEDDDTEDEADPIPLAAYAAAEGESVLDGLLADYANPP